MKNDKFYNAEGLRYFKQKQYDLAIENFNKAIDLKNDNEDYYRNRGYCYYEMKQPEAGDKDFNEASVIDEIKRALIGIEDRFCSNFSYYLDVLIKHKNDSRFANKIQSILKIYYCE